ncbi:hypothetical protein CDAR_531591 [Caerostris darwini]|uniref:Uncharacterized protein n=1 Tax=Caerostris darwini TaxID=1538125 RepID=A0AAV4QWD2_9ARAC|nr:hypothetical protein CDAR_531591 [Caerostris darwini]
MIPCSDPPGEIAMLLESVLRVKSKLKVLLNSFSFFFFSFFLCENPRRKIKLDCLKIQSRRQGIKQLRNEYICISVPTRQFHGNTAPQRKKRGMSAKEDVPIIFIYIIFYMYALVMSN